MSTKKIYNKPIIPTIISPKLMAVPLAFFSAATAAGAAVGLVAGAAAASKVMSATPEDCCSNQLSSIKGMISV